MKGKDSDCPIEPGDVLAGRYVVAQWLGEGTFGWVFSATDRGVDPPGLVAIKLLRPEPARSSHVARRLEARELEVLRRVQADGPVPNVVCAIAPEVLTHEGLSFLVLELIEGPSLKETLRAEGMLPSNEVVRLGVGLSRGLAAIHAAGGIHRDLKPSNIRLRNGTAPVILDLGIVKAMWETQEITATGSAPMSPLYASPEQLEGEPLGVASDVYSLGLILYEMLTGSVPLSGQTPAETRAARSRSTAPDPRTFGRFISDPIAEIVLRCLHHDPSRRPTAAEVAEVLVAPAPSSRTGRNTRLVALGIVALLLLPTPTNTRVPVSEPGCTGWKGDLFATYARPLPSATHLSAPTAVELHPSLGDGTFGIPVIIDFGVRIHDVLVADFDGDGFLEVGAFERATGVYRRFDYCSRTGRWSPRALPASTPISYRVQGIADLNGDGYMDLFGWPGDTYLVNPARHRSHVGYTSFGGPGGAFTHVAGTFTTPVDDYRIGVSRHARDVDGDGCLDLAFVGYESGGAPPSSVYLYHGDCRGGFMPVVARPGNPPGKIAELPAPANGVDLGDLDGDGKIDLLAGLDDDGDPGQCWILKGNGKGLDAAPIPSFDVAPLAESGQDGPGTGDLFIYDWNGDGIEDVILHYYNSVPSANNQRIVVELRFGSGDGNFSDPTALLDVTVPGVFGPVR